ncbi:PAS domain-containing protein [Pantoea sp. S61]|uniref:helix-turn-helix transcriptional regulator n=1 Tax=Pantoea sp. S61 TaxID=2767442 RepID=UPI00190AB9D3|nr:PAS domain-containing protein [Pantoea sp. S61]MBK0122562.1 PAS domain-containing protein [Pantoea sp. S61]MBK0122729.1 PAS domain-containing protein [Pantoea sp. S61]
MSSITDEQYVANIMRMLAGAVKVIGSVIQRNAEVVLHDLRQPEYSIAEIVNAEVTGRKRGDSVLAGLRTDRAFISAMERKDEAISLLLDYPTFTREGKPLRSSTAIYRDRYGVPFAALCINVDNADIEQALRVLQSMTAMCQPEVQASEVEPAAESPDTIEDLMSEIINTTSALNHGNNRNDIKRANLLAVKHMQEKGLFLMKGGVEKAAAALGVTRYTIYNYLDEIKNENS